MATENICVYCSFCCSVLLGGKRTEITTFGNIILCWEDYLGPLSCLLGRVQTTDTSMYVGNKS